MIAGRASGISTRKTICVLLAPKLLAASITLLSTSSMAASSNLAIKGAEPMVSGTIAAVVPMLVPTMSFVSGKSTIIRIIKGKERKAFTIAPSTL